MLFTNDLDAPGRSWVLGTGAPFGGPVGRAAARRENEAVKNIVLAVVLAASASGCAHMSCRAGGVPYSPADETNGPAEPPDATPTPQEEDEEEPVPSRPNGDDLDIPDWYWRMNKPPLPSLDSATPTPDPQQDAGPRA